MKWATQQQIADRYEVTTRTVRNWAVKYGDRIPAVRADRYVFYSVPEFDAVYREVCESYG